MKRPKQPRPAGHMFIDMTGPNWVFRCERCGERFELVLPQRMRFACGVMKAFTTEHRRCPKPAITPRPDSAPTASSGPVEAAPAADSSEPVTTPPEEPKP